jgi:PTH2 family peptidyl-tRNA hydrolase
MSKTEPKQVIIVRKDLNMRKGKMVAQGAHASMAAVLSCGGYVGGLEGLGGYSSKDFTIPLDNPALCEWLEGRFTKICVSVDSEQELVDIIQKAKCAGIITSLITDAGLTEFNGVPTITCGAIGPEYPENLNELTGHLKLL